MSWNIITFLDKDVFTFYGRGANIPKVRQRASYMIRFNDLFSRFEQPTLNIEKLAETTDPTTDRHGHDEPSRGSRSKILRILKIGY